MQIEKLVELIKSGKLLFILKQQLLLYYVKLSFCVSMVGEMGLEPIRLLASKF